MDKEQLDQLEQGYKEIIHLDSIPEFRAWRLEKEAWFNAEINAAKMSALSADEGTLRGLLFYEAKIKQFFDEFRQAEEIKKSEK